MKRLARNLSIAWQTEREIAHKRLGAAISRLGAMVIAGLAAFAGLSMLNAAAFFALEPPLGTALAALVVGGVNLAIAGIVFAVAFRMDGEPQLRPLIEVRDLALREVAVEAQALHDDAADLAEDLRRTVSDPLAEFAGALAAALVRNATEEQAGGGADSAERD